VQEAAAAVAAADQTSGLHIHFTDAASYMRSVLGQGEVCSPRFFSYMSALLELCSWPACN